MKRRKLDEFDVWYWVAVGAVLGVAVAAIPGAWVMIVAIVIAVAGTWSLAKLITYVWNKYVAED